MANGVVRYGDEIFVPSRRAIRNATSQHSIDNAFTNPTGPIPLGIVNATPPNTYQLGPGDKLNIRVSSNLNSPIEDTVVVDSQGALITPISKRRIVIRGQTLQQAEQTLKAEISTVIRNPSVMVTLQELRTFTVTILGESYAPGAYQVPATFSVFNLILATGGPTLRGTLRSIQLRRNNTAVKIFDLYRFLIEGKADQDIQLQPGDVIYYPISKGLVSVEGEVNRPANYEITGGETLRQLLDFAGGVRPSAVAQNVAVDSVVPGSERRLLNINVNSRIPSANPIINDGDKIRVFSIRPIIRNQVEIIGPVEQPRAYALTSGMRISDLIQVALGIRPEADRTVAELRRANPDGSRSVVRVNLAEALAKAPAADIELKADDQLTIFDINDISWRGDRIVVLSGGVRSPGSFYRADNLKVGDLVRLGRGLVPDVYTQEAHIQRFNRDGTPGALVKINPVKAVQGDPEHDLLLQDRDQLRIYRVDEWSATPALSVEVSGAIQRPGTFPLAEKMTIKDLISLAGGTALDAYLPTAFLQRTNRDGTLGPLVTLDVAKALQGDPQHNQDLQSRDKLTIYSLDKAQFMIDRTVTILGGVQRAGGYPRGEGMTLKNLIDLSGGILPNSEKFALIAAANAPEGSNVQRVLLDQAASWLVKDKDVVTIPLDASILEEPIQVIIQGAVTNPGVYFFTRRDQKLADLIEAAGGLRNEAWIEGAQFSRKPDYLRTEAQKTHGPRLLQVLQSIQDEEYKRAIARAEADRLVFISSAIQGTTPTTVVPTGAGTGASSPDVPLPSAATEATQLVTKARIADNTEALLGGNMDVKLDVAMKRPTSAHNVNLKQGDVLTIPEKPSTILVDGPGVVLPRAFVYEPGKSLRDYIDRSGGFTQDADPQSVLIIRPGGSLFKAKPSTRILLGDVIYVPTKVMVVKLGSNREAFERTVRTFSSAALVYGFFRSLVR